MFFPWGPLLEIGIRRPRDGAAWERLFPPEAVVFTKGRFALLAGLRLLTEARGIRRVWLPAYLCRGVVECVVSAGLEPRLYDVGASLEPRLDTIVPARGDALLIVHFFGLAVPMEASLALARAHGMTLIEDCAHTLPVAGTATGPGSCGDVSIFSLRKMAPVPDGAVLVVKAPLAAAGVAPTGGRSRIRDKLAQMALERVAYTLGWNVLAIKERLIGKRLVAGERLGGTPLIREVGDAVPRPARLVLPLLRRVDWAEIIRRRQEAYRGLVKRVARLPGVRLPVPTLPSGSVPQALPLFVDDASSVYHGLRRVGIEAMRWPGTEQVRIEHAQYPGTAMWLTDSLCLPLGAPLSARALDAVAGALAGAIGQRPARRSTTGAMRSRSQPACDR